MALNKAVFPEPDYPMIILRVPFLIFNSSISNTKFTLDELRF
jgi:hypothetical protein